jgi:hypothetical protein
MKLEIVNRKSNTGMELRASKAVELKDMLFITYEETITELMVLTNCVNKERLHVVLHDPFVFMMLKLECMYGMSLSVKLYPTSKGFLIKLTAAEYHCSSLLNYVETEFVARGLTSVLSNKDWATRYAKYEQVMLSVLEMEVE